jgi:arginyl-tRNA--protein-N-Asp/Glu arginylyltransferase
MSALHSMHLFHTAEHVCGYWPDRVARDLVLDPHDPLLPEAYADALALGFRRSGGHVYRPHCNGCHACVPVRVPVDAFVPDRSQRRCLRDNDDLDVQLVPALRDTEHLELYRQYLSARHPGGGMDGADAEDFERFLTGSWSPTRFLEIRDAGRLLAVAVTDVLPQALSAVYTFFDPDAAARGLGTFAVLQQIALARRQRLPHLYLGFWIEGHPKMQYKSNYSPLQLLDGDEWRTLPR